MFYASNHLKPSETVKKWLCWITKYPTKQKKLFKSPSVINTRSNHPSLPQCIRSRLLPLIHLNFVGKRAHDLSPSGFISKWKRRKKCPPVAICYSCPPSVIPPCSPSTHHHPFYPWKHSRTATYTAWLSLSTLRDRGARARRLHPLQLAGHCFSSGYSRRVN